MKLIVGLGNPGKKYEENHHNAGFLCVDFLQKEFDFEPFALKNKLSSSVSRGTIETEQVLLVKPETGMNRSGTALKMLLQFYKLLPSQMAVIHDDLDLAPGRYKTTLSSQSAGHNGVQDIIDELGTQDFFRLRLGIGRPAAQDGTGLPAHDFVLQNFSHEELVLLTALFPRVKEDLLRWILT